MNFKLDIKYLEKVLEEMAPFFAENNIVENNGVYSNETKSIIVKYDEARTMFTLSVADVEEGTVGEYSEINAWLFDESQNMNDAVSVGIDFTNSLRKEFGIKRKRADVVVDLPTASKDGNYNISSFAKKVLDVFPALKDEYKNHIAVYGNFLYLNFFGEHLVPRLVRLFEEGTKKQIKKFYEVANIAYNKGDRDTVNAVVAVLAAAAYNNQKVDENIKEMLNENTHFLNSYRSFVPFFNKNKKLIKSLIKGE